MGCLLGYVDTGCLGVCISRYTAGCAPPTDSLIFTHTSYTNACCHVPPPNFFQLYRRTSISDENKTNYLDLPSVNQFRNTHNFPSYLRSNQYGATSPSAYDPEANYIQPGLSARSQPSARPSAREYSPRRCRTRETTTYERV